MRNRAFRSHLPILAVFLFGVPAAWGQVFGDSTSNPSALRTKENQVWHVFGRVTTLDGQGAGTCAVRVQVATQSGDLHVLKVEAGDEPDALDKSLQTNLQGEFQTDFSLDPNLYADLKVQVLVRKPGYPPAHETVDFGSGNKTWSIDVILPQTAQGAELLSLDGLISIVGTRLRGLGPENARAKKDFEKGAALLLDQHNAARALPNLASAVKRDSSSIACRLLYGLALLDDGSWAGGEKEFGAAAHLNETAKSA